MSQLDYIQLRQSGYYLRYTLAQKYKCLLSRGELRYSLRIHKLLEAKSRARRLIVRIEIFLDTLAINGQYMQLTDEQIHQLVRNQVNEERQHIEDSHLTANFSDRYKAEELADTIDGLMTDKAEMLASSNFREVAKEVTQFLNKNGVKEIDADSLGFKQVCREYIRGQVSLYKYNAKLLRGGETLSSMDYMVEGVKPVDAVAIPQAQAPTSSKLSELTTEFLKNRILTKDLGGVTVTAYRLAFAELIEILGDVEVSQVNYDQAIQ